MVAQEIGDMGDKEGGSGGGRTGRERGGGGGGRADSNSRGNRWSGSPIERCNGP